MYIRLLFVALGYAASSRGQDAAAQHLRVECAMPVVGQPMALQVRPDSQAALPDGATVHFAAAPEGAEQVAWEEVATVQNGAVGAEWTPAAAGPYIVTAHADGALLEPVRLFVVSQPLHLNYWACLPTQRYVTSVMENSEDGLPAEQWLDRGVLPLRWQGGQWYRDQYDEPQQWADMWAQRFPGRVGIMIDEFGGGDDVDQLMGEALLRLRQSVPELFQAPYCVGVSGEKMIRGFAQADLVLAETYCHDWRGYGVITDRVGSAIQAGLGGHAIAVLGLGGQWASTERELRAEIAYARTMMPDMPGISFFPEVPPHLAAAVDSTIYDYFLGPAILVRGTELRNIGQLPAAGVRISLPRGTEQAIGELAAGERVQVADGARALPGEAYTVVEYVPPTELPPPDSAAVESTRTFESIVLGRRPRQPLGAAELELESAESGNPDVNGQVSGATVDLHAVSQGAVGLAFDIEIAQAWFYGTVGISLVGNGRLGVSFGHGDHDRDVEADRPRAGFLVAADDGMSVGLTCPTALQPRSQYHVFVGYDGDQAIRASITAEEGPKMIWESGLVPFHGPLTVGTLRFDVTPFEGSSIAAAEDGGVFLRGVSGGPKPSPYVLEAVVRQLAVTRE